MAESEEELKSLLTRVKNLAGNSTSKKTKIIASGTITSWQIEGEKMETFTNFIFLGSKITEDSDCSHEIKKKKTHTCFFVEKLEPIIQSEVSQKEKHQYSILTHIYGI